MKEYQVGAIINQISPDGDIKVVEKALRNYAEQSTLKENKVVLRSRITHEILNNKPGLVIHWLKGVKK